MITKQQALEFIYELSKKHDIVLDVPHGYMEIDSETDMDRHNSDFNFSVRIKDKSLEKIFTIFIQMNLQTDLFKQLDFPIPVDVDMLEVGQTYKVEFLDFTGVPNSFTEKLLSITEEDKPIFNFSNGYYTKYIDIKEIYKVNEHANM
jgi:hypothetical protein